MQPIPILVYADLQAAHEHLTRVFGFQGRLDSDENGQAVHGEVDLGDGVLWLHQESDEYRLASPDNAGISTGMMAVVVDDVDDHFARARDEGADIVYEPVDQPYGYREYSARDPEGHLWSFMKPLD
jgi:MerR family transcriptional regulator, thiopeptide resistance regulator